MRLAGCVAIIVAVLAASVSGASASPSAAPPASVTYVEPLASGSKIAVERVAAGDATQTETWRLNLDINVKNTSTRGAVLKLASIRITYPGSSISSVDPKPLAPVTIAAGAAKTVVVPEARDLAFPVAGSVQVQLGFAGYDTPLTVTRSLVEWKSVLPDGAYLFPGKREDLPDGWYWADGQNHVPGSKHRISESQRFAYDFSIRRWDGKQWTTMKPNGDKNANEDRLIWGMPVYAMADGWVLRCYRNIPDNKIGTTSTGSGNGFRIVHANGEVALYAHFHQGTAEKKLCPREGVNFSPNAIKVKAGDLLGQAGNSGSSSGPHLHVHIDTTGQVNPTGQGRPLPFRRIRIRFAGADFKGAAPCSAKNPQFASVTKASPSVGQLIEPLYSSGYPEIGRNGLPVGCFQDLFEAITAAGYTPFWLDGFDVKGKPYVNALFRPGNVKWVLKGGLTRSEFQSEIEEWVGKGYRPTLVESYRENGATARFAFIAEQRSGPKFVVYHDRSAKDQETLFAKYKGEGLTPTNVSVVSVNGKSRYTVLWEKRSLGGWQAKSTMTSGEYQQWLLDNAKAKRHLVYVNAYVQDGKPRFSAIVSSKASVNYAARHDLSASAYQDAYDTWRGKGLLTQAVTGYDSGGQARYAGLWRK